MRLVVLSDNRANDSCYSTEHGLSVYVEFRTQKWLLDVGKSDVFLRNSKQLEIDMSDVDFVFLSHAHLDHTGGLSHFLKENKKAKVFVSENVFGQRFYSSKGGLHEISSQIDVTQYADRIIIVSDSFQPMPEVFITVNCHSKFPEPLANVELKKDDGCGIVPDNFNHEMYISFGKSNSFVFTGCGHRGLLNILDAVTANLQSKPLVVMVGFHLLDAANGVSYESEDDLMDLVNLLNINYGKTKFYTGHCTGDKAFEFLKRNMPDNLHQFYAGFRMEF